MTTLPFQIDRTVVVRATPEVVFRFFTRPDDWARWWGAGSTIDARRGGRVLIRYPDGTEAVGEVVELDPPRHIVFTYGYASGQLIPPGGSRVTIDLVPVADGTRVRLTHDVADASIRDQHVDGWRYQMSLFSVVVADDVNAGATAAVDGWFTAWSEPDAAARQRALEEIAAATVAFRDRFSNIAGMDDLLPHLAASHRFMPGITLKRTGDVRHCQGTALADWVATASDGAERASGTNVFVFGPTGKIAAVTGLWGRHPTQR